MTYLDISMFMYGKTHFKIETDSRTRGITYQGKWQCLYMGHNFLDCCGRKKNNFYIRGLNGYDCMQVNTVEQLHSVAVLMGYDDEILEVIDSLADNA